MNKPNTQQKKKFILNYVYAAIIGLFVVACAVTIALVNKQSSKPTANIGGESVEVSTKIKYVLPMENATIAKDYSAKELQYNDTLKQWEIHKAIDFLAGENLDVFSIADGTVSKVYTNALEGGVVEVTHANGLISTYKSLDGITVKVGDKVTAGTVLAKASATMGQEVNGGNHLHFEMSQNGAKLDPNNYLALGDK
ncbi:MAG: M23 family metallopeptidase [Clostridiales bacterium]|nr:M23 family metallopeptidase [Clostridiales bacterium]